jgi:hypothetical protein
MSDINTQETVVVGSTALLGWIDCRDRMPGGWERKVFVWVVWPETRGWGAEPEPVVAWWKHGPSCFAFDNIDPANHLVTHWMEIPDLPNKAVIPTGPK